MIRPPIGGAERGRDARALASEPPRAWPDRLLHHGTRVALLLVLAAVVTAAFPPEERMRVSRYAVGVVAEEEIRARVPFAVPKSDEELARDRQEARASVPPTFEYRPEAVDSMGARLERFFQRLEAARDSAPELRDVLGQASIDLTPSQIEELDELQNVRLLRQTALSAVSQILPQGVADGSQLQQVETQEIIVRQGEEERPVPREEVLAPREFYERAIDLLPAAAPPDVREVLRLVLIQFLDYSLELNVQATASARERAAQAVPTTTRDVLQNEVIVRAGDQITPTIREELEAHEQQLRNRGMLEEEGVDLRPLLGSWLMNTLILSVFGLLLFFFRSEIYDNFRWVLLIAVLVLSYVAATFVVVRNELPTELLPVAFVSLAVAVLWDGRMALVLALVLSILTGAQPPFQGQGYAVVWVTLVGGAAASLSVRAVRRRAQTWVFSAIIAAAYAAALLSLLLMGQLSVSNVPLALVWATANAVLSSILAMGFLPMFELATGITTDQTLLEWADPNRSLLKRLSMEAPGTYAHTINVANLAEAAANGVGANGLLCRVGLYYHDVGKMLKPHYFVENQPDGRNPHDRLKPATSASIVKEHVTEGHRMAREANVPDLIASFIPEHHGTQRIGFFWEKAKEELGEDALDPEDFVYPGPKPQSKETAIAMLADSVESATRALQDPTPERVRDLIENIVDGKIADGQLDESPLTLREIRQIKEQFIKVLSGIYHHRIDYPQTKHLTDKDETGAGEGGAAGGGDGGAAGGDGDGGDAPAASSEPEPTSATGAGSGTGRGRGGDTSGSVPAAAGAAQDDAPGAGRDTSDTPGHPQVALPDTDAVEEERPAVGDPSGRGRRKRS